MNKNTSTAYLKYALILALGSFSMGNAKFSIMQLLPLIALDLNVSINDVEDVIWSYTLGSIIGAPLIAIFMRKLSKQTIIFILSCCCFLGNLLSSFASNIDTLFWLRFFSGIPHAAYLALAALITAEIAPPGKRGMYIGMAFSGLAIAMSVSVPFNAVIGNMHGWNVVFLFVALIDILTGLLIKDLLPRFTKKTDAKAVLPVKTPFSSSSHPKIVLLLSMSFAIMTAMILLWSYGLIASPMQLNLSANWITVIAIVLGFGLAGGQIAGGFILDKNLNHFIVAFYLLIASILSLFMLQDIRTILMGAAFIGSLGMMITIIQVKLLEYPSASHRLSSCTHMALIQAGAFVAPQLITFISAEKLPMSYSLYMAIFLVILTCILWYFYHLFDQTKSNATV